MFRAPETQDIEMTSPVPMLKRSESVADLTIAFPQLAHKKLKLSIDEGMSQPPSVSNLKMDGSKQISGPMVKKVKEVKQTERPQFKRSRSVATTEKILSRKPFTVKHWFLDRETTVYASPASIRFVNSATCFNLSEQEWALWISHFAVDEYDVSLTHIENCKAVKNDDGVVLTRNLGSLIFSFDLNIQQLSALEKRVRYINAHLDLLKSSESAINAMYTMIAGKMLEVAKQLYVFPYDSSWCHDDHSYKLVQRIRAAWD